MSSILHFLQSRCSQYPFPLLFIYFIHVRTHVRASLHTERRATFQNAAKTKKSADSCPCQRMREKKGIDLKPDAFCWSSFGSFCSFLPPPWFRNSAASPSVSRKMIFVIIIILNLTFSFSQLNELRQNKTEIIVCEDRIIFSSKFHFDRMYRKKKEIIWEKFRMI